MQHSPINRPAISKCSRCGRTKYTQHLAFKQNVSYFFARKERQFSGDLCFFCASRTFASVELTTLLLTVGDNLAAEVGRRRSSIPARSEAKSGAGRPGYAYHLRSRYTYWLTL